MFILKSRSPRRIQILRSLGLDFQIEPADISEEEIKNELPLSYLKRITWEKIDSSPSLDPLNLYLSSDTIVVYKNRIMHKPNDRTEAFQILKELNGKEHQVYSGCTLFDANGGDFFYEETIITFQYWNDNQIRDYIDLHKPYDKAGSYGIQDSAGPVLKYAGSYHNVLGFPLRSFFSRWQKWNSYQN